MKIVKVPRINALWLKGPEFAPDKILSELGKDGEEIEVDNSNIETSYDSIYRSAKKIFDCEDKVVFVGGDHSISAPILKAFGESNGFENSFLIVFDAHADCMEPMKEPTHEEIFRSAIEYGFKVENVILVGVRKIEPEEKNFLEKNNVKVFGEIGDLEAMGDYITERANGKDVYVSVDVDVLDPAFAPAVNCPEVNGLSSRELFYLLRRLFRVKGLKALDVVEVVPAKDEKYDYRTVKVAAGIVDLFLRLS
jgi:agmatinase